MKTLPTEFSQKYASLDSVVYVIARIKFKDGTTDLTLNKDDFRILNNSYTENGGNAFPIGISVCKTIELNIDNFEKKYSNYNWYDSEIFLYSRFEFSDDTYCDILEGIFYVDDIKNKFDYLTITANDFMIKTEIPGQIFTQKDQHTYYSTIWDYFDGGVCQKIAKYYNPNYDPIEDEQLYISAYDTPSTRFTNSTLALTQFDEQDKNDDVTYRDILGYIAQIACGNAVIVYEEDYFKTHDREVNTERTYYTKSSSIYTEVQNPVRENLGDYYEHDIMPKIKIKEYDLSTLDTEFINCGIHPTDNFQDIIDCGTFTNNYEDIIECGNINDVNYMLLDKFTDSPEIEFSDVAYDGVQLSYPNSNGKDLVISYPAVQGRFANPLKIYNPILVDNALSGGTVAQTIFNSISYKAIRPFSGNYLFTDLLEFMDTVILMNRWGELYTSFVGFIINTYLSKSEISNSTPTISRNNQYYYNLLGG